MKGDPRTKTSRKIRKSAAVPGATLNIYDLVEQVAFAWIAQEKGNTQSKDVSLGEA